MGTSHLVLSGPRGISYWNFHPFIVLFIFHTTVSFCLLVCNLPKGDTLGICWFMSSIWFLDCTWQFNSSYLNGSINEWEADLWAPPSLMSTIYLCYPHLKSIWGTKGQYGYWQWFSFGNVAGSLCILFQKSWKCFSLSLSLEARTSSVIIEMIMDFLEILGSLPISLVLSPILNIPYLGVQGQECWERSLWKTSL